jgi:hypothetical protein
MEDNILPSNLALIALRPECSEDAAKILKGEGSLEDHLVWLSNYFPIRVWFKDPTQVVVQRSYKSVTEHVFRRFFKNNAGSALCYMPRKTGRKGYYFPSTDSVVKYEPVISAETKNEFSSYQQFEKKFDKRFITEPEILKLWNGTSGQHGGKYRKSDFHRLSKYGLRVMEDFIQYFKDVTKGGGVGYTDSSVSPGVKYREARYTSMSHERSFGRDIKISHQTNCDYVYYASEYPGCGNGRYGLIANAKEFLWLEDD